MKDRIVLRALLVMALTLVGATALSMPADAFEIELGGKLGLNYNLLSRPHDPPGEPTLLHGSAFTGIGYTVGAAATMPLTNLQGAVVALEANLLYSYHSGEGFAEFTPTDSQSGPTQRRTITITTHTVRLPVLLQLSGRPGRTRMRVGLGPDLVVGLGSSSAVTHENIPGPVLPLETTPKTHLTMTAAIGVDYFMNDFVFPFEIRANWNPFVGSSTRERFDDYQNFDNPGFFGVAFDWQLMVMTGVSWSDLF